MDIHVEWSGGWPALCHGLWSMTVDGKVVNDIPFNIMEDSDIVDAIPAGTFGEYKRWYFDENYLEQFETYEDGMDCDEWCSVNAEWLAGVAPREEWPAIYAAFQNEDWRFGECGGCI